MFLSFHRKDILFAICALFCDFIDDHFPGRTGSYIEYNRRSRTFVQYYCPANCLNVKFHIAKFERELTAEEDKSPNVTSIFPRLDFAAHYCSADWLACLIGKAGEEEASLRNIRQPKGRTRRLAFFNVETSSLPFAPAGH